MDRNGHEYRWSSFGGTASGNEAHPGARASRPHKTWRSLVHLLHPSRPATAPGLCFVRAHAVPAGRVAGCRIAGKLSGTQRECMRAGRPRSRVGSSPITPASQGGVRQLAGPQPVPMRRSRHACRPFGDNSFSVEPIAKFGSGTIAGNGHKRHKSTTCDFCAFCGWRTFFTRWCPILNKAEPQVCRQDDLPRYEFCKGL